MHAWKTMNSINDEIIKALKQKTPEKENTVNLLMDMIPLGREAAYRRLRGEIPFTLDEAVTICQAMNISIDQLVGVKQSDSYVFFLNAIYSNSPTNEYYKMLYQTAKAVSHIKKDPEAIGYRASRSLPEDFYYKYDLLAKVYLYIVSYQLYPRAIPQKLADHELPIKVRDAQKEAIGELRDINSILILNRHMILDYIEIVKYFYDLGVISDEEIAQIKIELHQMLDDIENTASIGKSVTGKKLDIYLSHISFDCTYTYISGSGKTACSIGLYCIDHLSCANPVICENQKMWIKSLKRFSTLISVSGELQRNEYFQQQREIIDKYL